MKQTYSSTFSEPLIARFNNWVKKCSSILLRQLHNSLNAYFESKCTYNEIEIRTIKENNICYTLYKYYNVSKLSLLAFDKEENIIKAIDEKCVDGNSLKIMEFLEILCKMENMVKSRDAASAAKLIQSIFLEDDIKNNSLMALVQEVV